MLSIGLLEAQRKSLVDCIEAVWLDHCPCQAHKHIHLFERVRLETRLEGRS